MALVLQYLGYFLIATTAISGIRIVIGPTVVDRLIGLSMISSQLLALLVVISVQLDRSIYLDVALVYDIFGFIGLLAIARFFSGRGQRV